LELVSLDASFGMSEEGVFTTHEFRQALGSFATGVVIVTTHPKGYNPMGLTVNSFASVSLDPPLVLWSIDKNSETQGPFLAADTFAVNVLRDSQEDLSTRFSTKGCHNLGNNEFITWKSGAPILPETLAQFDCDVFQRIDAGDHIIFLGKVRKIAYQDGAPLLFSGGSYRHLK
jgi:flavin reductase (DIM6/NTAB) family NADH-FMN oxidoreductase RutF